MIPKECKRLAEVDFPIAEVSRHSAREKSIRHGNPSTLHLWWARRPLAACRAVLLGLLLPDPCDEHCPQDFKSKARELFGRLRGRVGGKDSELRRALLRFVGEFANWDLAENQTYLEIGRGLVKAAHGEALPLVVDPFAGGGSIPLEALRLGCEAFASDLNPVACLILKVMLEDIPRNGPHVADEVRRIGDHVKKAAEKELAQFYPPDPDGSRPIAYLWARTILCESPNCGAEIPLMRSFWLCKKPERKRALRYIVERPKGRPPSVNFEIFAPKSEDEVPKGTVRHAKAQCPCCNGVILPERLRAIMKEQRGGGDVCFDNQGKRVRGARLISVVLIRADQSKRDYRLAEDYDYIAVFKAWQRLEKLEKGHIGDNLSIVPNEPVNPIRPSPNARGLSAVTRYGVKSFGDLFNCRQKLCLVALTDVLRKLWDSSEPKMRPIAEIIGSTIGKRADYSSTGTRWHLTFEKATCTFSKQALSMTWDYIEPTPLGDSSGSFGAGLQTVEAACRTISLVGSKPAQVVQADACVSPLPDASCAVWFTDPPYYDAIPYADLSDFFFVWLKRAFPSHPLFLRLVEPSTGLTPKLGECVWNQSYEVDGRTKDRFFFERTIKKAFEEGCRVLSDDGVGCVVFAHKTTEGWEALLSGMTSGGWVITASWPLNTERQGRLQSQESAALATSVHLLCRRRTKQIVGDWGNVLRELPGRVGDWMERLQGEGVRGADLVFACIGPALEIFSRYSKVETAEGSEVSLPEYLEKVWEVVGRTALEQVLGTTEAKARNGGAGALEEDARLTALFLWTLQSTNGKPATDEETGEESEEDEEESEGGSGKKKKGPKLIFDVVRRFAQPLGIHLPDWEGRIIEIEKGVVRLLPVRERTEQLFGEDGAHAFATELERGSGEAQLHLFTEAETPPQVRGRKSARVRSTQPSSQPRREATTLDRVHAAMLLQAGGQANALRGLLRTEQQRSPDFLRLANALSALYPKESEEKRLLDAMLLAVPR
jgi:putative DNA methylase